jgi:tRNA nucleotidyltransferase (CCA-adding enzyme)
LSDPTTGFFVNSKQSQEVRPDYDGYAHLWATAVELLTVQVTADDQVKAYIKKIMSQLKEWMYGGKISKLVVVITSKETGEHVERWQFDVSTIQSTETAKVDKRTGPNIRQECKDKVFEESGRRWECCPRVGLCRPIISAMC